MAGEGAASFQALVNKAIGGETAMLVTHGRALTYLSVTRTRERKMDVQSVAVIELDSEEASQIGGGNPLGVATLLIGAFGAGFRFGYYELAPRLFD
jgi:hypothetical protein